MKKLNRIFGTAAAVAVMLFLAACSNASSGSNPAPQQPPAAPSDPAPTTTPAPAPEQNNAQSTPVTLETPLTLEAAEAGSVVTFVNKATGPVTYKVNGGEAQTIASNSKGTITLTNIGDKIEFFGNNTRYATYLNNYSHITCDKDCYVYGNIMSLINSEGFESETTLTGDYAFLGLFEDNTTIKNKDGADLLLPATTLASYCYCNMFFGCRSLTIAPSLPATTLAKACYAAMFYDCRSLTIAPSLPATNLTQSCYGSMFSDCKSLATAPLLPANMLVQGCYAYMFHGCEILNNITCLATNISASECTDSWLEGVAVSGTFTKADGVTWPTGISGIPSGWTVVDKQ